MPFLTRRYKFTTYGEYGDIRWSLKADKDRFQLLENLLGSCFDMVGGGVIKGFNVYASGSKQLTIQEGMAVLPRELTQSTGTTNVSQMAYVAFKNSDKYVCDLPSDFTDGILGVFLVYVDKNTDEDLLKKISPFIISKNPIRNTTTDVSSEDAYMTYLVEGDISSSYNLTVYVNSKKYYENIHYNIIDGNKIKFTSRRSTSDVITVRVEPKNSIPLAFVTLNNDTIVDVDVSVKVNVFELLQEETISESLKSHKHSGISGTTPPKVVLTTSTNYVTATPEEFTGYTVYNVTKNPDLLLNTEMSESDVYSYSGTATSIVGNILSDAALLDGTTSTPDKLKSYVLNPNINQSKTFQIVSSTATQVIANGNIQDVADATQNNYLIMPYEVRVMVNDKEQYYGYYVYSDDNTTIKIKFDGGLDQQDVVKVKLYFVQTQTEVIGSLDINNINFGGDIFSTGTIDESKLPNLYHSGRLNEIMFPLIQSGTDYCWDTDTTDLLNYRPRSVTLSSLRNTLWIENVDDIYYACTNNTIAKTTGSRLFNALNWQYDGVPDMIQPIKMVKQDYDSETRLYAFNDTYVYFNKLNSNGIREWNVFLAINSVELNSSNSQSLTKLPDSSAKSSIIYDMTSDADGNLYLATDIGIFFYDPSYNELTNAKSWEKITDDAKCLALSYINNGTTIGIFAGLQAPFETSSYLKRSLGGIIKITNPIYANETKIVVSSASSFSVGKYIYIFGGGVAAKVKKITAISDDEITIDSPLGVNMYIENTYILNEFVEVNATPTVKINVKYPRCLYVSKNNNLVINNKYFVEKYDSAIGSIALSSTINAPKGSEIVFYKSMFGTSDDDYASCIDYFCIKNISGVANTGGVYTEDNTQRLSNSTYYKNITDEVTNSSAPILSSNFLFEDETNGDFYIATDYGIYQCSTSGYTGSEELIIRNAFNYLGCPLNVYQNAFKSRLAKGSLGYTGSDTNAYDSVLTVPKERTLKITCDLTKASIGDFIVFTNEGGGIHVNSYFRILSIVDVDSNNNKYKIDVDAFDGIPFTITDFKFGETFELIPHLSPVPIINDIPQKLEYTTNYNSFGADYYSLQTLTFNEANYYYDNILIATAFQTFLPKYGSWEKTKDYNVFLNGKNIKEIAGDVQNIILVDYIDPSTKTKSNKTKIYATNVVFSGLKLSGKKVSIARTGNTTLEYTIDSNDESSISIAGDVAGTITQNGLISLDNISYSITLSAAGGGTNYEYIVLDSPVTTDDIVTINITPTYITDIGVNSHKQIEDNFSEEETGLSYLLDGIRNSNFLQITSKVKEFVYSMPTDFADNVEFFNFNEDGIIDVINSTIENSKLTQSSNEAGKVSFNVFGLLYSESYGGTFALTEDGIFFRKNSSAHLSNPMWTQVSDLIDTLNPSGMKTISTTNPAGVYIGYDKKTGKWTISWGGFHTGEFANNGLNNINVVSCQFDKLDYQTFYLATSNNGVWKTDDGGLSFANICDFSSFDYENNIVKDFKVNPLRSMSMYLLNDTGLFKSYDGGGNFDIVLQTKFPSSTFETNSIQDAANSARNNNCLEINTKDGNELEKTTITFAGSSLYIRSPYDDYVAQGGNYDNELGVVVSGGKEQSFDTITQKDITYNNAYEFVVYDIAIDKTDNNIIYLATNIGIYKSSSGAVFGINSYDSYFVIAQPTYSIENNSTVSVLTVNGVVSNLNTGSFICPDVDNSQYAHEVINTSVSDTETTIKVKGKIENSVSIFVKKWEYISNGIGNNTPNTICIDPTDNDILYCGTIENGIFKYNGASWTEFNSGLGTFSDDDNITISKIRSFGTDVYACMRKNLAHDGGFFKLNSTWINKTSSIDGIDVVCFDVFDSDAILVGATDNAYVTLNGGTSWSELKPQLPLSQVKSLEWFVMQYGALFAGTNGAGLYKGLNFGNQWMQQFSKESINKEIIMSHLFRIFNIKETYNDGDKVIAVDVDLKPNKMYDWRPIDYGRQYRQSYLDNGEFLWETEISAKPLDVGKALWIDPSNYPSLTKQKLTTEIKNANSDYGFILNNIYRDPYASDRFIASISDHMVYKTGYTATNGYSLSRQGGAFIQDATFPTAANEFQGSRIVPSRKHGINPPRTFGVKCIARDAGDDTQNVYYAGTENAGLMKIVVPSEIRCVHGFGKIAVSINTYLVDTMERCYGQTPNFGINTLDSTLVGLYGILEVQNDTRSKYNFKIVGSDANGLQIEAVSGDLPSDNSLVRYAISGILIWDINGQTEFDTALNGYQTLKTAAINGTVDNSGTVTDLVNVKCNTGAEDLIKFINGKFYFSNVYKDTNEVSGINPSDVPFIINDVGLPDANMVHPISLGSIDIEFESGNKWIDVIVEKQSDRTQISISKNELISTIDLAIFKYCRIHFYKSSINSTLAKELFYIDDISTELYGDNHLFYIYDNIAYASYSGATSSAYDSIAYEGSQGIKAKINFSITAFALNEYQMPYYFTNNVLDGLFYDPLLSETTPLGVRGVCHIVPPSTVTFANGDVLNDAFYKYKNTHYNEFKLSIDKLIVAESHIIVAVPTIGILSVKKSDDDWEPCFQSDFINDLQFNDDLLLVTTNNGVYISEYDSVTGLGNFTNITPVCDNKINWAKFGTSKTQIHVGVENEGILFSDDSGNTYSKISYGIDTFTCPQWKFAYDDNDITNVFAYGFTAGIFKRNSDGTFASKNNGLRNKNVSDLSVCGDKMYAATMGGLFKSVDGGDNWEPTFSDNFDSNIIRNVSYFANTDIVIAITQADTMQAQFGINATPYNLANDQLYNRIYRSADGGATWSVIYSFADSGANKLSKIKCFGDGVCIFCLGGGTEAYKSTDYGINFSKIALYSTGITYAKFDDVFDIARTYGKTNEYFISGTFDANSVYVLASSFDSTTTWTYKLINYTNKYLHLNPFSSTDTLLTIASTSVTSVNAQITGTISYRNSEYPYYFNSNSLQETIGNTTNTINIGYCDFSTTYLKINTLDYKRIPDALKQYGSNVEGWMYIRASIEDLKQIPTFYIDDLDQIETLNGVSFEVFGISKITFSTSDADLQNLFAKQGALTNLYIKIGSGTAYKIVGHTYGSSVVVYVVGDYEGTETGAITIGKLYGTALQPITYMNFVHGNDYNESRKISTSMNYLDYSIKYDGQFSMLPHIDDTGAISGVTTSFVSLYSVSDHSFAVFKNGGYYIAHPYGILNGNMYYFRTMQDSGNDINPLKNGVVRLRTKSFNDYALTYITTQDYVYAWNDSSTGALGPDYYGWDSSAPDITKVNNNTYTSIYGTPNSTFAKITYPLVVSEVNEDCAYMIVDDSKMLTTTHLTSWTDSLSPWFERNLAPNGSVQFKSQYIQKIVSHKYNSDVVFMCVGDDNQINSNSNNGLYFSINNAASWSKMNFDKFGSKLYISNIQFANANEDELIAIGCKNTNGTITNELYTNKVGLFGNNAFCTLGISSSLYIVGTDKGLTLLDTTAKTASHFYDYSEVSKNTSFIQGISYNFRIIFITNTNKAFIFSSKLIDSTNDLFSSLIGTISFNINVNSVYYGNGNIYFCTENGIYYTSSATMETNISSSNGLMTSSFLTMLSGTKQISVNKMLIDETGNTWFTTSSDGLYKIETSGVVKRYGSTSIIGTNNIKDLCETPQAILNISNYQATLQIPATSNGDKLFIIKCTSVSDSTAPIDGTSYNTSLNCTITAASSSGGLTTLSLAGVNASQTTGMYIIVDGMMSSPYYITSATDIQIVVQDPASSITNTTHQATIYQKIGSSSYVLYSGSYASSVTDIKLYDEERYIYKVYYLDSYGKYYPAYKFDLKNNENTAKQVVDKKVYILTENNLFSFNYAFNTFQIELSDTLDSFLNMRASSRYSIFITYRNSGKFRIYDKINTRQSPFQCGYTVCNGCDIYQNLIFLNTTSGVYVWENKKTIGMQQNDILTKDYFMPIVFTDALYWNKIWTFVSNVPAKVAKFDMDDVLYVGVGNELYKSVESDYGFIKQNIKTNSSEKIVDIVGDLTLSNWVGILTDKNFFTYAPDAYGSQEFFKVTSSNVGQSLELNSHITSHFFDGKNIILCTNDSTESNDFNVLNRQFVQFNITTATKIFTDYLNTASSSGFNDGTGALVNSYADLFFGRINDYAVSKTVNADLDEIWCAWALVDNIVYYSFVDTTYNWSKFPIGQNYNDLFANGFVPIKIASCQYINGGYGVLITMKNYKATENTLDFDGTAILYLNVVQDTDDIFYHKLISCGKFDEKDPISALSKSLTKSFESVGDEVRNRYHVIDAQRAIMASDGSTAIETCNFDIISANSFGQAEKFIAASEDAFPYLVQRDRDVAYKLVSADATYPYSANNKNKCAIKDLLEYYRPYRSFISKIDPTNSDIMYVCIFNPIEQIEIPTILTNPRVDVCQILKTVDGGYNWFEVNVLDTLPTGCKINDICIDPTNNDVIYVGVSGKTNSENGVYVSLDGGVSFFDITGNLPIAPVSAIYLADDGTTGGTLYAGVLGYGLYSRQPYEFGYGYGYGYGYEYGYGYGYEIEGTNFFDVFEKDPLDNNWVRLEPRFTQRDGLGLSNCVVNDIAIGNTNKNLIYLATKEHGILKSVDGGFSWLGGQSWVYDENEGIPSDLELTAILMSKSSDSIMWVGTESGIYVKDNSYSYEWIKDEVVDDAKVNQIIINEYYEKNVVSFTIEDPQITDMEGFIILKREETPIKFVPTNFEPTQINAQIGDAILSYIGQMTDFVDGVFEFTDTTNIKSGIEYFYDIYYLKDGKYYKFPDVYTNEIYNFSSTDNTIDIQEVSGTVSSVEYNDATGETIVVDSAKADAVVAKNYAFSFGSNLIGFTATFSKAGESDITIPIVFADYDVMKFSGDYSAQLVGRTYVVNTSLTPNKYYGYVLNPSIKQKSYVMSNGIEKLYAIKDNTQYQITVKLLPNQQSFSSVANMITPKLVGFYDRHNTIFSITSSRQLTSSKANLLYVLTDSGLYISENNGETFVLLNSSDSYNCITFEKQSNLSASGQVRGWIAGDSGLYYSTTGFITTDSTYSKVDGKYTYVKVDENDTRVIYAHKDGTGMLKSIDGGITFSAFSLEAEINTATTSDIGQALYLNDYTNNIMIGTSGYGVVHVRDSARDNFDIKAETDVAFENFDYSQFKITDQVTTDVNSIKIYSQTRPTTGSQISSVSFETSYGNYVNFDIKHKNYKANVEDIKIGEYGFSPMGVPFRLRIPGSSTDTAVGFSIRELYDGTIMAGTNKGAYYSKDGSTFSKIDNFLIPDLVFSANKFTNGYTYLTTNNGVWINNGIENISSFHPKYKIGSIVTAFWSFKNAEKEVVFMGGNDGLTIKFRNYPYISVTTSNNFEATDGIKIAWGEENEDGAVNPGGIDDVTLSYLNEHRSIMDWSTGQYVDTAGWAGTLLVRIEGNEPNGFYPSNAVSYEKGDRRYVDAIRKPYFDITPEEEITLVKTTIPFVDGMTIAANIKSIKPRESYGYTQTILSKEKLTDATLDGKTPDTFTIEEPYVDTLSVTANGAGSTSEYDDYTNEYGAYMDNNTNPQGAELKSNTTYTYSLFAYYERPSNFVFQGSGSSTMLMRIYAPVKVKEFSTFIEIKNMPNASIITCGAAINEYNYYVGTDDGIFYTDMNKGLTKSEGTYEHEVYSILIDEQTTSFYDYGYGYSEYVDGMDFFDAFGEEGLLYGYSVYGYNAHYGYGYAYGYESDSSNIIYAATNKGILMSIDGGKVFENIFSSEYYNIKHVFCLEKDRDGNVLAGTDKGIYRKDPTDDTLWYFDSVVGSADYAPLGKILGQTFKLT